MVLIAHIVSLNLGFDVGKSEGGDGLTCSLLSRVTRSSLHVKLCESGKKNLVNTQKSKMLYVIITLIIQV